MGQRADGNNVNAGQGYLPNVSKLNTAGGFDLRPPRRQLHHPRHIVEAHIVQHNDIGARLQGLAGFGDGGDFHLDSYARRRIPPGFSNDVYQAHPRGAKGADVIVFNQYRVPEVQAVVVSPAHQHRIFLQ